MFKLSPSRVSDFRSCPKLYFFRSRGWQPKRRAVALNSGLMGHRILAALHTEGVAAAEAVIEEFRAEWDKMFPEEVEYYGDIPGNLAAMLDLYLQEYGAPDVQKWEVSEESFFLHIGDMTIECKPDLVVPADGGGYAVIDHKFTSKFPSDRTDKMSDLQLLLYGFVLEQNGMVPVRSVMWNFLKHKPAKTADNLWRLEIPYSHRAAMGIMKDFIATAEQIRWCERHEYFSHHVSQWCGSCAYKNLCTMEVRGHDISEALHSSFVQELREDVREEVSE